MTPRPSRAPRAVVSGGAGFIGSHVVAELDRRGWRILVIDDLSHAADTPLPDAVELLQADCGAPAAADAIERFGAVTALHLAARGGVVRADRDPAAHVRSVLGSSVAFYAAARNAGVERIVTASSGGALYGDAELRPTPETFPCNPRSTYGAEKLAEEVYLAALGRTSRASTLALRFGNVYGPAQDGLGEAGVVAITARRLLGGLPAIIRGDGEQTRDFVFVGDVARAVADALDADVEGALNVGTGVETSVQTVVDSLVRAAGMSTAPLRVEASPTEVRHGCLSTERIHQLLGWQARTSLATGLTATFAWFADHPLHTDHVTARRADAS